MSDPIFIPREADLAKAVLKREVVTAAAPAPAAPDSVKAPAAPLDDVALSFLRSVADLTRAGWTLEKHWKACGVTSGSRKAHVLDQLRGCGFIRLEKKGAGKAVHVFDAGWAYLGLKRPTGLGTGGAIHQKLARHIAGVFQARGYDVHIEFPVGASAKRVDVAAFGPVRVGVEIALSRAEQELENLRGDLESGCIDGVLVVAVEERMLRSIRRGIDADAYLQAKRGRIVLSLLEGVEL